MNELETTNRINVLEHKIDSVGSIQTEIDKIVNGTVAVAKAQCDENGNNIASTYVARKSSYAFSSLWCVGAITNLKKDIRIFIPLPQIKLTDNVSISLTSCIAICSAGVNTSTKEMAMGGYVINILSSIPDCTVTYDIVDGIGVTMTIRNTTNWLWSTAYTDTTSSYEVVNNNPLAVQLTGSIEVN